jgi:hypothetical protein
LNLRLNLADLLVGGTVRKPIEGGSEADEDEDDDHEDKLEREGVRVGFPPKSAKSSSKAKTRGLPSKVEASGRGPTSEDKGSSSKAKGKGKRVPEPNTLEYVGEDRCELCLQTGVSPCIVNQAVQEKWISDWEAGVRLKKALDGSTCQTCSAVRKRCELPATEHMRPPVLKRKRGEVDEGVGVEKGSKLPQGNEGKSGEPAPKRAKRSGDAKIEVTESSLALLEASAAASAEALDSLVAVGRSILREMQTSNYLAGRLAQAFEDPPPRFLREEIRAEEEGSDEDFAYVSAPDEEIEGSEEEE